MVNVVAENFEDMAVRLGVSVVTLKSIDLERLTMGGRA